MFYIFPLLKPDQQINQLFCQKSTIYVITAVNRYQGNKYRFFLQTFSVAWQFNNLKAQNSIDQVPRLYPTFSNGWPLVCIPLFLCILQTSAFCALTSRQENPKKKLSLPSVSASETTQESMRGTRVSKEIHFCC